MIKNILFLFLIGSFVFHSCNKDEDTVLPVVKIVSPNENSEFDVLQSIVIQATISDNEEVSRVQVSLISDVTRNKVLPSKDIIVGAKETVIDFVFELSDSLLPSGRYYFQVEAFDKENSASAFRYINIRGINKQKLGVLVSCDDGNSTTLYADKNDFTFQSIHQFSSTYQASVFNSSKQHFWFLPKQDKTIEVFNALSQSIDYSETVTSVFDTPFSRIKRDDLDVFYSIRDQGLIGNNQNFARNFIQQVGSSSRADAFAIGEKYALLEVFSSTGTNREIDVLARSSGVLLQSRNYFNDIVDFQFKDDVTGVILYNNAQGGGAVLFDAESASVLNNLFTTDSILSSVKNKQGDLFVATKTGVKYFRFSNGSFTDYISGTEPIMAYDEVNDQLYVGLGNTVNVFNYPLNSAVRTAVMPNRIVGINVRFNIN